MRRLFIWLRKQLWKRMYRQPKWARDALRKYERAAKESK